MSDDLSLRDANFEKEVRRTLKDHWHLFLLQGILLAAAGAVAIIVPQIATVAIAFFIGWLLIAAGGMRLMSLFNAKHVPGFWGLVLIAAFTVLLGAILALAPVKGALTLTMVLVVYFFAHGIASFVFAYAIRSSTDRWPWMLLSGLVDMVLAGIIVAGWPGTADWVPGLLVGVNMVFTGLVLIFAAAGARLAED
jgi:uncharacterized membrane protein HdeD (DUF308 family)